MIEESIEIQTPDGLCDGLLLRPEGQQPLPGVIFLTDIIGIRPSVTGMARRLAAEGYVVWMPNVFYRTGRPPLFDFVPKIGDERSMQRFGELAKPLTPQALATDAAAHVKFLHARSDIADTKFGVVGYCYTGGIALRFAAEQSEAIVAAASFHGGSLFTDAATSPHRLLPQIKAQLYFGHAVDDRTMPSDAIRQLESALAQWGGNFQSETYDGALHGWTVPQMPVYNEVQAERAFTKLCELFTETLR